MLERKIHSRYRFRRNKIKEAYGTARVINSMYMWKMKYLILEIGEVGGAKILENPLSIKRLKGVKTLCTFNVMNCV